MDYPPDALGTFVETSDGILIHQQSSGDPRRRAWVWKDYPYDNEGYKRTYERLSGLRARTRFEQGLSPFVYLLDNVSGQFERLAVGSYDATTAANVGGTGTVTVSQTLTAGALIGGELEVIAGQGVGQRRYVTANTTSVITVDTAWTVVPNATSDIKVRYRVADWFKARVVDVSRKVDDRKMITTYAETKLVFVVQDTTWNNI